MVLELLITSNYNEANSLFISDDYSPNYKFVIMYSYR